MGCGGGRAMVSDVVSSRKIGKDTLNEFKKKYSEVLKKNAFYNLDAILLNKIIEGVTDIQAEEIVIGIELDKLTQKMVNEVVIRMKEKLSLVIQTTNISKYSVQLIVLFLNQNKGFENQKKHVLGEILQSCKSNDLFDTGMLSYLIIQIILIISDLCFYFLITPTILQSFEKLNSHEIELLLIDKVKLSGINPEKVPEYLSRKIQAINPKLRSPQDIINTCIPFVFRNIKETVINNPDQKYVLLGDKELDNIINNLIYLHGPMNFIEVIITSRIIVDI